MNSLRNDVELESAREESGHYFAFVRIERNGEQRLLRFGVDRDGYLAFKRALQFRPFDQLRGIKHRYFFLGASRLLGSEEVEMSIRVVSARDAKNVWLKCPYDLAANLYWFQELDDWDNAEHLAVGSNREA